MKYPHLAARIFNTPLLIHPQKLDAIIAGLGGRLLGDEAAGRIDLSAAAEAVRNGPLPADMFSTRRIASDRDAREGYSVVDGVAVMSVSGALVHRGRMEGMSTRLLGYNDLAMAAETAQADTDVHAILQIFDTPGGEAQGAFEYYDRMRALQGGKPMLGIADGLAASAGYLAASALDEFAITKTGYAGSIGVVMRHVDFSGALAADGIRVTHIYAGDHKVDGNPYQELPASVRADFQAEIDDLYKMFIEAVATGRRMDAEAVRKTQAKTYRGAAAVAAGLADRISTTDQMISELAALRARSYPVGQPARATAQQGDASMSDTSTPAGQAQQPAAGFTKADIDRARAEGVEQGIQAERTRVGTILAHESAACTPLALQCINTGLTTEQSTAILGAAPAPAPAAAGNAFAAAMGAVGNPSVTGIEAAGTPENTEAAVAASIVGLFSATRQ
jgi:signal peptide peptidase SppA